jgi:hypothetical protein
LDRAALELVLAAVARAGGSHEQSAIRAGADRGLVTVDRLLAVYPWPDDKVV